MVIAEGIKEDHRVTPWNFFFGFNLMRWKKRSRRLGVGWRGVVRCRACSSGPGHETPIKM
jgi:hypothetical protein